MKASLAESFIPRERAARPGGRSPNSGSKPATEPQRAPPGCAGFPNRRFGPFGRLALLAFVLTAMLQPLHLALAQMNCVNCSNNFTFQCGMSVATCFPGAIGIPGGNPSCIEVPAANVNLNGYSLVMMDTRTAPARLWLPPMFHNECPQVDPTNIWNAQNLGTVFGITLDTATPPNIYVAATSIYVANRFVPGVGPGGVFKIDGSTFAVSPFSMIPSVGSVSLGDICYDKVNHQFFVSELDRGLIWRLDGTSGAPTSFYDHGVMGRQNASPSLPTIPDNNMPDELTVPGRRVFGLQIHDGRLFYAVWTNGFNEIWSVGVVFGGVTLVPPNGPKLEIPGTVLTSPTGAENGCAFQTPVSDIAFSSEGDKMLLGERGICVCDLTDLRTEAHESRVREFTFMSGTWTLTTDYRIGPDYTPRGQPFPHRNAAGGVDYDCNGCIYATGDLLKDPQPPYIYGVQVLCPPTCTNDDCSYLIDLNCDTTDTAKTQIGDVEVYRCCEVAEAIGCRVTGGSNHQLNSIHAAAPCPVTTPPTHISHGGQVGAPFSAGTAFTPSSPCISGEWQHNRHLTGSSLVGTFHASGNGNVHQFDSLLCACLPCPEDPGAVGVVNGLCNPDRRICGPEPRRAPANKITFSGVGDYTFGNGVKTVPAVFRVDITDRSEGNSPSSTLPPDRYRFRAWLLDPLCPHAVGPMLLRLQASANPATIG